MILIHCSDYFKKLLLGSFNDNKIKFNVTKDIIENIVKYMYLGELNYDSINQLIKMYNFCDEILYKKLQNIIGIVLFDKYELNDNFDEIKIHDKKF